MDGWKKAASARDLAFLAASANSNNHRALLNEPLLWESTKILQMSRLGMHTTMIALIIRIQIQSCCLEFRNKTF